MHILILPSWYPLHDNDLNGSFFREQAHALANAGVKVGVIAPQFRSLRLGKTAVLGRYDQEVWLDGEIPTYFQHGVFWFPRVPYLDLKRWVNAGLALFDRYVKERGMPDILHVHSLLHAGPLALEIHKKYRIPYCVTEHSSVFGRELVKDWEWERLKQSEAAASELLAVSKSLADLLQQKLNGKAWTVFPNLLDDLFTQSSMDSSARKYQLCAVAFLHAKKGFDVLIKAFATVVKTYPQLKLVIGGDGPERAKLESLIKTLDLDNNVTLLGALSRKEVCQLMRESLCFVLSSYIETFGVVVIEALSQGTPVVSTLCGGPESILTEGDGLFVKPGDEKEMAKGILEFLANQDKFDNAQIRQRCIDTYSKKPFVHKLTAVYQDILDKK
ncbi:RfaG protein [Actinobacillus succinogenes]|uniref:Glycosyl transferase group 1 n=1 Tax=Actinobacillus succinogenes (strain ATCC 55618 / DSM 22257 / CCUG 43843 / 130Z) TaxID=339671 RepID=A6VKI9_ACTSZ|nr:glycosyltransferase [Actinobacillus succinogenes]ABR73486.1 glycosyl transferase group 1 [Actinobacillus succinogenes 130Z]PHI40050.1 RfaG protein [Actinobacillus succinogenes]